MSDVNGGVLPQANGSPIFPGTTLTGPILAGNIVHSDGSNTNAGLGSTSGGNANVGYCVMAQSQPITQAASAGQGAGVYQTTIVIPAQSQILEMTMMVTAAWSGAAQTFGVGNTSSATAFTAAGAGSATALGPIALTPGSNATAIANWDNTGNTDVQIVVTSSNTGTGAGTLTVQYIQGINNAS
jgi:hypothetical protein